MQSFRCSISVLLASSIAFQALLPTAGFGGELFSIFTRRKPPSERDHSVERLAKEIDELQYEIDTYGTVVPKAPDVWGQARLTKHRQEYEAVMQTQLYNFHPTLQASLRRSDESFLGLAMTLNATAPSPSAAAAPTPPGVAIISQLFPNGLGGGGAPANSASGGSGGAAGTPNPALAMIDNNPITTGYAINRLAPIQPGLTEFSPNSISVEPTVMLDQLSRYLEHLKELRRINEGDDTADSPGYSLNLVRIPVSVTPGKKTRKGYGAELTVTAHPYLSEELLPMTMRNLVVNDIVDQLSLGLLRCLEDVDSAKKLGDSNLAVHLKSDTDLKKDLQRHLRNALTGKPEDAKGIRLVQHLERYARDYYEGAGLLVDSKGNRVMKSKREIEALSPGERAQLCANLEWLIDQLKRPRLLDSEFVVSYTDYGAPDLNRKLGTWLAQSNESYATTRFRRSSLPFPPSQIGEIYGPFQLYANLMQYAQPRFAAEPNPKQLSLLDVQNWLRQELESAYDFLSVPCNREILWTHCSEELVQRIQARATRASYTNEVPPNRRSECSILALRDLFFEDVSEVAPGAAFTATQTLAWAIIVESAMLTNRLIEDIDQVRKAKGCPYLPAEKGWLDFYGPDPTPEAREIFRQYVMCRWPVHVFALDPMTDDQNEADTFSRRRELQVALAVGVATGAVSANAAMRFMRRLELDLETIALNRTAVGFAHGDDTFGWRFYPRVQTPPTARNGRAFLQSLTGAPTEDQDLRQRQLEPAMRECEAVVIMPSFVPYITFESRANWFCLTHPRKLELTLQQSMKLSRTYQAIRREMQCVHNSNAYRTGDVGRLKRVVDQLDREMPLQTMQVQVPFENSLGGFEMFSTGISDLGPEFRGFYGAPGVRIVSACAANTAATAGAAGQGAAGGTAGATAPCCSPLPASGTAAPSPPPAIVASGTPALTPAPPGPVSVGYLCPGVDMSGNQCAGTCSGTTLFLVGKRFGIHETKVIAGGKCVPFVLLSREIMRVTIPCDVDVVVDSKTKAKFVDVHLATPYGVTSRLPIPAVLPDPTPASPSINWDTTDIKAQICYWPLGSNPAGKDLTVRDFAYLNAPKTIKATDSAHQTLHPTNAVMQFRVLAQAGTADPVELGATPAVNVTFKSAQDQGTLEINFQGAGAVGDMIKKVITDKLTFGQQASAIVVETYVNFDQPQGLGLPNVKFDKPITIALTAADCSQSSLKLIDSIPPGVPDTTMPLAPEAEATDQTPAELVPTPATDDSAAVRKSKSSRKVSVVRRDPRFPKQ